MKSYGDLDDEEDVNGQGCLRPVLSGIAALLAAFILSCAAAGCRSCTCPPDMAQVYEVLSAP